MAEPVQPAVPAGIPPKDDPLALDPAFFRRLEQLALVARRLGSANVPGQRESRGHGTSVEFADFRDYMPGDDLRFVDWNAYARLDRLFIKLFHAETPLALHLLIDTSPSMAFGTPDKFIYARKLAASLAYMALAGLDQVTVAALTDGELRSLPLTRGKRQIFSILDFLRAMTTSPLPDLNRALTRYAARQSRHALAVVISDFLDPASAAAGLAFLRYRGYQVALLHVLSPEEWDPAFAGDFLLTDSESGAELDVTASAQLFARYRATRDAWLADLELTARRAGCNYARVLTTAPLDEVVLRYLRQRHLVA